MPSNIVIYAENNNNNKQKKTTGEISNASKIGNNSDIRALVQNIDFTMSKRFVIKCIKLLKLFF